MHKSLSSFIANTNLKLRHQGKRRMAEEGDELGQGLLPNNGGPPRPWSFWGCVTCLGGLVLSGLGICWAGVIGCLGWVVSALRWVKEHSWTKATWTVWCWWVGYVGAVIGLSASKIVVCPLQTFFGWGSEGHVLALMVILLNIKVLLYYFASKPSLRDYEIASMERFRYSVMDIVANNVFSLFAFAYSRLDGSNGQVACGLIGITIFWFCFMRVAKIHVDFGVLVFLGTISINQVSAWEVSAWGLKGPPGLFTILAVVGYTGICGMKLWLEDGEVLKPRKPMVFPNEVAHHIYFNGFGPQEDDSMGPLYYNASITILGVVYRGDLLSISDKDESEELRPEDNRQRHQGEENVGEEEEIAQEDRQGPEIAQEGEDERRTEGELSGDYEFTFRHTRDHTYEITLTIIRRIRANETITCRATPFYRATRIYRGNLKAVGPDDKPARRLGPIFAHGG